MKQKDFVGSLAFTCRYKDSRISETGSRNFWEFAVPSMETAKRRRFKKLLLTSFAFLFLNYSYSQKVYQQIDILTHRDPNYIESIDKFSNIIDTSSYKKSILYLRKEYLCGITCDTMYFYIKFVSDSVLFQSFPYYSYPSAKDIFDFSYGNFGIFKIEKSEICFRVFANRMLKYVTQCGRIYDNLILLYNHPGKRSKKHKLKGDEAYYFKYQ